MQRAGVICPVSSLPSTAPAHRWWAHFVATHSSFCFGLTKASHAPTNMFFNSLKSEASECNHLLFTPPVSPCRPAVEILVPADETCSQTVHCGGAAMFMFGYKSHWIECFSHTYRDMHIHQNVFVQTHVQLHMRAHSTAHTMQAVL